MIARAAYGLMEMRIHGKTVGSIDARVTEIPEEAGTGQAVCNPLKASLDTPFHGMGSELVSLLSQSSRQDDPSGIRDDQKILNRVAVDKEHRFCVEV